MESDGLDFLAFVSSFYRFAGPNNPILDLGNYLVQKMDLKFGVVTTANPLEPEFARCVFFPVIRGLSGSSNTMLERLVCGPVNVVRARRAIAQLRPRRTFVVASHDTAFEVAIATGRRVVLGQNVLLNVAHRGWAKKFGIPFWRPPGWRSRVFEGLDITASKTILRGILAHSRFQKDLYVAMGIPAEKIRIVPHCIDTKRVEETGDQSPDDSSDSDRVSVLFAGHLEPWKGVIELIAAAEVAAEETPLMLRFVGQGPLEGKVRAASSRLGLDAHLRIELVSWTSPSKLFSLMRKADMIAIPSCVELFGMAALEAMALGKPVIATRYGGIAEVIRHGQDGLLVDPFDRREFADALARLAADAGLRRRLGTSGRERVRSEYDVHAAAPRFVWAMEELC